MIFLQHIPRTMAGTSRGHCGFARIAACLALALACIACAPPAYAVNIQFWTTEDEPDRLAVIRYLTDSFMALHDGIRVEVVPFDENELPDAMEFSANRGELPALVYAGSEPLVAFADAGYLDIKTSNALIQNIERKHFYTGALNALTHPGTGIAYALPFHGWVQGIWYRADWFAEAGLAPPTNIRNIVAAARALNDPAAGRYGILVGTKRDTYAEQVFTHLALSMGIREFDDEGRLVFNTPKTVQLLKDYKKLAACTPEGPQTWRARDYYLQGKLAMMFYSTFIMDDLALSGVAANSLTGNNFHDLVGANFDPNLLTNTLMVPVIDGATPSSFGVMIGIGFGKGQSYEQREAAMKLLRFLYRTDAYVSWLHMAPGGMLPVVRGVAETDIFYRDLQGVFRRYGRNKVAAVVDGLNDIRSFSLDNGRLNPAAAKIMSKGIIPDMIYMAVFEDVPAAEAVNWAEKEMRKVMEKQ